MNSYSGTTECSMAYERILRISSSKVQGSTPQCLRLHFPGSCLLATDLRRDHEAASEIHLLKLTIQVVHNRLYDS